MGCFAELPVRQAQVSQRRFTQPPPFLPCPVRQAQVSQRRFTLSPLPSPCSARQARVSHFLNCRLSTSRVSREDSAKTSPSLAEKILLSPASCFPNCRVTMSSTASPRLPEKILLCLVSRFLNCRKETCACS